MLIILFFIILFVILGYIKPRYKILCNIITSLSCIMYAILFIVLMMSAASIDSSEARIEKLVYENYQIEGEVMDILYEYHKEKYPNGEMSYDPEPSITLIDYYPEAWSDKRIKELKERHIWNTTEISIRQEKNEKAILLKQWLINFNLW